MNIDDLPAATNNRSKIPPPDKQVVKMLFEMRDSGDAEALLKASEGRISQYIFWLDLHRFVAEALTRLGNRHQHAHDCVCSETAFLLYRLRGLEEFAYSDGMPFANPETKTWIQGIAFGSGTSGAPGAAGETAGGQGENSIVAEIADAQAMIRKGKLLETLSGLQLKLNSAPSIREKVLWRQAIVNLLINVKQVKLALPHLSQIVREIDTYHLEEYEPSLAVNGLKLAWLGYESQTDPLFKEKAADILSRIGCLDMAEVVRLQKG
jgi:type VI secretion system protein VasJ